MSGSQGRASRRVVAAWMVVIAQWTVISVAGGCGTPPSETGGFLPGVRPEGEPLVALSTDAGLWDLSLWTSPSPPRRGAVDVMFRIAQDPGGPADGLRVQVIPWMPAHGHGTSAVAAVTPLGDGWYLARPVYLYMAGRWELRTSIEGAGNDAAVPVFEIH